MCSRVVPLSVLVTCVLEFSSLGACYACSTVHLKVRVTCVLELFLSRFVLHVF